MTVSSPCYLAVAVNCELINVKAALGAAELLFLAVHSHVVSDLTPKILNLLLLGAAFLLLLLAALFSPAFWLW